MPQTRLHKLKHKNSLHNIFANVLYFTRKQGLGMAAGLSAICVGYSACDQIRWRRRHSTAAAAAATAAETTGRTRDARTP